MSKRRGNVNLKAKRARSWQRGEERHKARNAAQAEAHRVNRTASTSPWQAACQIRFARRAQDPEVQGRRRQYEAGTR